MTPPLRASLHAVIRSSLLYAAVLLVGSVFFFALHYVGNRTPYDIALERIIAEVESDRRDLGYVASISGEFEYCQRVAAVLGGAKRLEGDNAVFEAVLPRLIAVDDSTDYCERIPLLRNNENVYKGLLKHRYWWGSNPLHAIALRFLSDADIREWTRILTIFSWGLLAFALWFLSRKALLVVAPVGVFAVFFSGLQYFSDAGTGMPFLWTPLFAAALAFVMYRRSLARATRLCCFIIGMGSSYLWLLDGHNVLIIALIGLVVYFGSDQTSAWRRIGTAVLCIALYIAGFALCYAVGQLVKAAFLEWIVDLPWTSAANVFEGFFRQISVRNERLSESFDQTVAGGWADALIIREFTPYWIMGPNRVAFGQVVTFFSGILFAISLLFAIVQSIRGRKPLLADIAWIFGLAVVVSAQFIITDDILYRSSRYLFALHGLCWSCFFLALREVVGEWRQASGPAEAGLAQRRQAGNRRSRRRAAPPAARHGVRLRFPKDAAAGVFLVAVATALAGGALFGWSALRSNAAFARETTEQTQPRVFGPFNVYYNENRLVYQRAECSGDDTAPRFTLSINPVNVDDLPDDRVEHGFDNLDFYFAEHEVAYGDGCAAVVNLPDYEIAAVWTGQYIRGGGLVWGREFSPGQPPALSAAEMTDLLEDAELLAQAEFDLHRNEDTLLWVKTPCVSEDTAPKFFVRLLPVSVGDLPQERQQFGFDNMDFNFADRGTLIQGRTCVAAVELPDYPVAAVRTGQFTSDGAIWGETVEFQR